MGEPLTRSCSFWGCKLLLLLLLVLETRQQTPANWTNHADLRTGEFSIYCRQESVGQPDD